MSLVFKVIFYLVACDFLLTSGLTLDEISTLVKKTKVRYAMKKMYKLFDTYFCNHKKKINIVLYLYSSVY